MEDRERWSGVAEAFTRSFGRLCAGTVDSVLADLGEPTAGGLADIGCGTGNVTRVAVGRGWRVTAVDADSQMLDVARRRCAGLPVGWVRAALPRTGLRSGTLDAVVANFVVNCVDDPVAATRELMRVVRPGGLVALTVWARRTTAHTRLIAEALAAAGAPSARGGGLPADLDFDRTPPGLAGLARAAGLEPLQAREITWEWSVSWDDLWAGIAGGVGSTGQDYLAQPPAIRERVRHELRDRTDPLEVDGTIRLPSIAVAVLARRPH